MYTGTDPNIGADVPGTTRGGGASPYPCGTKKVARDCQLHPRQWDSCFLTASQIYSLRALITSQSMTWLHSRVCFALGTDLSAIFLFCPAHAQFPLSWGGVWGLGASHLSWDTAPRLIPKAKKTWNPPGWAWSEVEETKRGVTMMIQRE